MDRLVKYTGFGNAAGLLASYGLMGGSQARNVEDSEDENSDTEEYLEIKDQ